jgi:hypothetical protein
MRQRRLNDNLERQSFSSWLGDIRFKKQDTIANDVLCSVCANFSSQELSFDSSCFSEPFDLGTVTEVRSRTDRCPLCRVAFQIVSQALESSQEKTFWPEPDQRIILRFSVERPDVQYSDKKVGRISLYPRTRSSKPKRHLPRL